MKRLLVIVGLIFLGGALVFLNQGVRKSAVSDKDEDEQAQQAKAPATPKAPAAPTDPNSVLPAEETVGDPAPARHHIQVGWVYDASNQQKPEVLTVPIQAIRDYVNRSGGMATAEIVDLDVPMEDRSPAARAVTDLGIRVDGRSILTPDISKMQFPPDEMAQMIEAAIRSEGAGKK